MTGRPRRRVLKALAGGALGLVLAGAAAWRLLIPDVASLRSANPTTTAFVRLYVRKTEAKGKRPVVMMRWVPLSRISKHLQHAVVIAEDDMFFRHHGVDWEAVRQAYEYNRKKGRIARGGSTITQQTARNLYLSPARNPVRKLRELFIAWELERTLTKPRILELYLNVAEWGAGIFGAEAASQIYFGKPASDLTVEEAVALAAALPSPWRLNPARPQGPGMARRKTVLVERMRRAGYLPAEVPDADVEVPDAAMDATDTEAASPGGPS